MPLKIIPGGKSGATRRVVIVGAGPGGLAASMLLAAAGADVTVIERLPDVGGRSRTLRANGFQFDMGPTFFLYPRVLAEIFQASGRRLDDEVELLRLDPQYNLVFGGGGNIEASPDVDRLGRAVAALAPEDAAALPRFMADNRAKLDAFRPALERPFASLWKYLSPDLLKALPSMRPWRTVEGDLARYFKDPRVRLAFSFQSKYLGMSPYRCPSLFTILSFLEYEYGVFHPRGGCGAVMRAMARAAVEMGVHIRTGEAVNGIDFEGRRAVGVRTPRAVYPADAVVVNADFSQAMIDLVPDQLRRRWTDKAIARKKYSCSTFMMYLGLEGSFEDVHHHTIYLSGEYDRNLADIESGCLSTRDPSFYVQNACVTDRSLAPKAYSTLYVLVPVANQRAGIDWRKERAGYRDLVLKHLSRIGIDGVEQRIRYERVFTPADWETGMNIYEGATFNLAHSLDQMLYFRPHNRFQGVDGLYLVGGGTHPGSGLPVIFESARITSRLMAEDLDLRPRVMPEPQPIIEEPFVPSGRADVL